jgi:carbonic anhydrase
VVMGHENKGAVTVSTSDEDPVGYVGAIIQKIKPAFYVAKRMERNPLQNTIKINANMLKS